MSSHTYNRRSWLLTMGVASSGLWLGGCGGGGEDLVDADAVAQRLIKEKKLPGVVTLTCSSGSWRTGAAGSLQHGSTGSITERSLFAIGSLTKALTATLAGTQVQVGKMSWEEELYAAIPSLATIGRPEYAHITLRDLLTHHSGIYAIQDIDQYLSLPSFPGDPQQQRHQFLRWAVQQAPRSSPGTFQYSNGGYVAVAAWLEEQSGQSYESMIHSQVFAPLHIQPMFIMPAAANDSSQPWPHHAPNMDTPWQALDPTNPELMMPPLTYSAGGLSMRPLELLAYLQMNLRALRGKKTAVLTAETARTLHTEVNDLQAMGWVRAPDFKGRLISFAGGSDDFSFYAMMAVDASRDRAAAVLSNGWRSDVEDVMAQALTELLD